MVNSFIFSLDIAVMINILQDINDLHARENVKGNKFALIPQICIREYYCNSLRDRSSNKWIKVLHTFCQMKSLSMH